MGRLRGPPAWLRATRRFPGRCEQPPNAALEVVMTTSVIVAGARTPIGRLMGSLKDFSGSDLGAIAIAGALEKTAVAASSVD